MIGGAALRIAAIAVAAALVCIYWLGAERHLHVVNVDPSRHDQSAYLEYGQQMAVTHYSYFGGRNRMPVFPFLLSLVYQDDLTPEQYFVRGKYMNLVVSLVCVAALFFVARRQLPTFDALLLTVIGAFTLYVYKAAYTQAEILYYTLLFASFAVMVRLLRRPTWLEAALGGVLSGFAYLTKAAIPPLLAAFGFWGVLAAASAGRGDPRAGAEAMKRAGAVALLLATFLLTTLPYLSSNKQRFGVWFYNVNAVYYVWYDSWDEVLAKAAAYGDTQPWPDLPEEQIPSARRYWREHSLAQIGEREVGGLQQIARNLDTPLTYGDYPASFGIGRYLRLYGALCVLAVALRPRLAFALLTASRRWVVTAFAASYVLVSILLYAFYVPIAPGPRHPWSLYLPLLFSAFLFLGHPLWQREPFKLRRWSLTPRALHAIGAAFLVYDLAFVYPTLIVLAYAGR